MTPLYQYAGALSYRFNSLRKQQNVAVATSFE